MWGWEVKHKTRIIVCSFSSGIDDMKRYNQRDIGRVLAVLDAMPIKRFSVFEATANMTIARTMTTIVQSGYITTDTESVG